MAAAPPCPAPPGSSGDGPIGSWTTASSAKRASHALRSLAATAAWDLRASSRASTATSFRRNAPPRTPAPRSLRTPAETLRLNLYDTFCPELTARLMIVVAGPRYRALCQRGKKQPGHPGPTADHRVDRPAMTPEPDVPFPRR